VQHRQSGKPTFRSSDNNVVAFTCDRPMLTESRSLRHRHRNPFHNLMYTDIEPITNVIHSDLSQSSLSPASTHVKHDIPDRAITLLVATWPESW
jgi:NADPH-dependent 7-cyano-7-deazaguanine reductase QueF-like protein